MNNEELIPVGKVTGAHGIRGEARVMLYGGADEFPYTALKTGPGAKKASGADKEAVPIPGELKVRGVRKHKGFFLVFFEGFETRSTVEALAGVELLVKREDLPELSPDEFYLNDLLGLSVKTEEGRDLGTVTGIIPTGASDVLEINGPAGEILLPMAGDFIRKVDVEGGEMVVRLLEGMLPGDK